MLSMHVFGVILHSWEVCVVVIFWAYALALFTMLAMLSNQFCMFSGSYLVVGKVMLWMCQLGVLGVWWL